MDRSSSKEITETILKIGNAKSVEELDTEESCFQAKKIAETLLECSKKIVPEPELSEILSAFRGGGSSKAHLRLIELRSGRSIVRKAACPVYYQ